MVIGDGNDLVVDGSKFIYKSSWGGGALSLFDDSNGANKGTFINSTIAPEGSNIYYLGSYTNKLHIEIDTATIYS